MKTTRTALAATVAACMLAACSVTSQSPVANGTYSASAQGMAGPVPVTVTFESGAIKSVEVGANKETVGIGQVAAPKIAQRIASSQSTLVDSISGATVTSNAVIKAVRDCVVQAGLPADAFDKKAVKKIAKAVEKVDTDLVVVGGGGAGMIAAINASQQGLKVVLLEKMNFLGGASGICAGGMLIEGSKLQKDLGVTNDSAEKFIADMRANGDNLNDPVTLGVYAKNVGSTVDWLVSQGVKLKTEGGVQSRAEFKTPRLLLLQGGCPGYAQNLREMLGKSGTEVLLGTRASEIIIRDGRAAGVKAEGESKLYEINAKAVILATGGYGANREMLPANLQNTLYYGPVSSTGDGHKMAEKAGAKLQLMQYAKTYYNGVEVAPGIAKSTLTGNARVLSKSAIMVNKDGRRVVGEKDAGRKIVAAQAKQPGGQLYLVMDAAGFAIFREGIKNNGISAENVEKWLAANGKSSPVFASGMTLDEAARNAGINPDNLIGEVIRFNNFVDRQVDDDFGRKAKDLQSRISETGPYYIVEQKPRFATTMGSVVLNDKLEVLDTAGKVIPGLYAAGEVANSVHGNDSAPAANVGWTATSAKTASDNAVKAIRSAK